MTQPPPGRLRLREVRAITLLRLSAWALGAALVLWLASAHGVVAQTGAAQVDVGRGPMRDVTASPAAPAPSPAPAGPPVTPPPIAAIPQIVATPQAKARAVLLDSARAELDQQEAALRRPTLSGDELQALRLRIDPIGERLRDVVDEVGPELAAAKARLDQLGPKPKDGATEGAEVARDRAEREAAAAAFDETQRIARALLLQAEQLTAQISGRRRASFTTALFTRSYGLVSPDLWIDTAAALPRDTRALRVVVQDTFDRFEGRTTPGTLLLLGLAIGVATALHIARRHLAPRIVARNPVRVDVSPRRSRLAALGVLLVEALPAAAGSFAIYQALVLTDVLPARVTPVFGTMLGGLAFTIFVAALIDAVLAPGRPGWRLFEMSETAADRIRVFGVSFAGVLAVGKVLDAVNEAVAASLPLSIATRAVVAAVAALVLAEMLRRFSDNPAEDEACLGPYIPTDKQVGSGPARLLGWLVVALIAGSALVGYVAFASFLTDQVAWVGVIVGMVLLAVKLSDEFIGQTLKEQTRVSIGLQANLGLRQQSLRQLGVLASGLARVALVIAAIMLALAPWGIESGDVATNLRAAFFGFKVGEVTISVSSIIVALLLFGFATAVTRLLQRWLDKTFLPTTDLDSGLRNSIRTAVGYVGFFVSCAVAFTYLGLSLEKIAIVAGALSVGIGFGLQSIVNNFVSGLILLFERPIRVGDLVVVGGDEGYIRKISVRATEIETFDRSTVIVPNSSLISGTVKNRVRGDRTGRVVLTVQVLRNQDPAHAAHLLSEIAGRHPDVLEEPPPRVVFKKIGDTWLDLDLFAYVEDVTKQLRVQSDLNFEIFKMLVDEGILPPLGPGAMDIGGLEPVQDALKQIAAAIAAHDAARVQVQPRPGPRSAAS